MEKVAIIGMGISGSAVLDAYAKHAPETKICCFDKPNRYGRGYPFGPDDPGVILNLPSYKISYDYRDNRDFARWFKEQSRPYEEYASRKTFGEYISSRLQEALALTQATIHHGYVADLDFDDGWVVTDEAGHQDRYDRVHLCNGSLPQREVFSLSREPGYYSEIYPLQETLADINPGDPSLVLGTGLSGVDVISHLLAKGHQKLIAFSPSGQFPTIRSMFLSPRLKVFTMPRINKYLKENFGRMPLAVFEDWFFQELAAHGISYEAINQEHLAGGFRALKNNLEEPKDLAVLQGLLPSMNLIFNKVWTALSRGDRPLFRQRYHRFHHLIRSPLPPQVGQNLIHAGQTGHLQLLSGQLQIETRESGFSIKTGSQEVWVKNVINATGMDTGLTGFQKNPLLASLLDKRYAMMADYGGFLVRPEDNRLISPRYGLLPGIHAHGLLTSGVQYRNNSTMIIQHTARQLVKNLAEGSLK